MIGENISNKYFAIAFLFLKFHKFVCRSAQQQQPQPNFQEIPVQSWYPPSVVGSPSPFSTPTSSSVGNAHQRAFDRPQSPSQVQPSPTEAAGIIARLKDKRCLILYTHIT